MRWSSDLSWILPLFNLFYSVYYACIRNGRDVTEPLIHPDLLVDQINLTFIDGMRVPFFLLQGTFPSVVFLSSFTIRCRHIQYWLLRSQYSCHTTPSSYLFGLLFTEGKDTSPPLLIFGERKSSKKKKEEKRKKEG